MGSVEIQTLVSLAKNGVILAALPSTVEDGDK